MTQYIIHRPLHHLALAATMLVMGSAHAANLSKGVYAGAKDDIKAAYKAEREACNNLSGNAKDVCVETAKGRENVAMARLEFHYTGKLGDEAKMYKAQYQAEYDIAKEKCDDLGGQQKDVCTREAKSTRDKAESDLKLAKKVANAADTAVSEHLKADMKLAREKCDTLAGDAKDICMASAKARYAER